MKQYMNDIKYVICSQTNATSILVLLLLFMISYTTKYSILFPMIKYNAY